MMKFLLFLERSPREILGYIREGDKYKSFAVAPSGESCILAQCKVTQFGDDFHFLQAAAKVSRGVLFFADPLPIDDLTYSRLAAIWEQAKDGEHGARFTPGVPMPPIKKGA